MKKGRPPVCYERVSDQSDHYILTSCMKKRLSGESSYMVTTDTNKVTCCDCKNGLRYIKDRQDFIYGR